MTIIEFFDSEMLENILGTLIFRPDNVILFGKDRKKMDNFKQRAEQILAKTDIHTQFSVMSVNTNDFFAVKDLLTNVSEKHTDCMFDLLGGDETVLTAMGAVSAEKNIPLCSINPRSKRIKKITPTGQEEKLTYEVTLSIDDIITLFGGSLTESKTISPEQENGVLTFWDICKKDCGKWNTAIEQFASFIPSLLECPDFDGMTVSVPKAHMQTSPQNNSFRADALRSIMHDICTCGLAKETITDTSHIFTLQSPEVLSMLEKSGNILELYTLYTVYTLKNENDFPLISSAASGAVIDWDSVPDTTPEDDVKNEIDILATAGEIPVFISCKNGMVNSDELYKLNTVAERFGGEYAKKILVMTYFDVPDSFIQRAHAMNIRLIRNVHKMTPEEFAKRLEDNIK